MKTWIAHSKGKNPPVPAQTYQKHISGVLRRTEENTGSLLKYYKGDPEYFRQAVRAAAIYHDLGKLDKDNQLVLSRGGGKRLPINHVDAGVANLLKNDLVESALLVYSHHIGLQSIPSERAKEELFLRDANIYSQTQEHLREYLARHSQLVKSELVETVNTYSDWTGLTRRLALSSIVDADHSDTAYNYGKEYPIPKLNLKWEERLKALDNYVENLGKESKPSKRNLLRKNIYLSCKEADTNPLIYACDSPVGTGKTTAVMAHLLKTAIDKKFRHIIVVLPYTNIINQSVDIYRKALVLPGEKADEVVAEHHHQSDFNTLSTRQLTSLWKSPIIVTTAVQFFETIASNHPSKLRKLHELPGSGVFIDEVHSAIPNYLWPQTWKWMKELGEKWGCHFVLASGSLPRFWELKDMVGSPETIPELVSENLRIDSLQQEEERIKPQKHEVVLDDNGLVELIFEKDKLGPRLVIMNTVQSAAVFANKLAKTFYGEEYNIEPNSSKVLHLSTSLAPADRAIIVEIIKNRLQLIMDDERRNFTLVATSCVEAGIDFSFRSAFRERAGAANLIQVGGRVRRNNEDF
jgi:CRISPR-associated endonuclease/helicase Cas3